MVARWMRAYARNYPLFGQSVTREQCELVLEETEDIDVDVLDRAMKQAFRVCERFPTVAEIRRIAGEVAVAIRAESAEQSRQRSENCPACKGVGWIFVSEDRSDGVRRCGCRGFRGAACASETRDGDRVIGLSGDRASRVAEVAH